LVRDLISQTYPEELHHMSERMFNAGGFYRGDAARERKWKTDVGKAKFSMPNVMSTLGAGDAPGRFHLITMRSNDQFNTTVYGHSDRHRGLDGDRSVVLMSRQDMDREGLREGNLVTLVGDAGDGVSREVRDLRVTKFALQIGCLGGYYPEMNPLAPLWYHDKESKTPGSKGVPVRIRVDQPVSRPIGSAGLND